MADDFNIEEVSLILFMLNREQFNRYYSYIVKLSLEQETKGLLKSIAEYFRENEEVTHISVPEFMAYFCVKHPILKKRTA